MSTSPGTGDEVAHGDTTCGGDQVGELSSVLKVGYVRVTCQGIIGSGQQVILKDNATIPHGLGVLGAGATGCLSTDVAYPATTANTGVQTAQSDRVTWRYKFTAQA